MRLDMGETYKISKKLKNAFDVQSDEAKIVSISAGIVILEIDSKAFPLKLSIAADNLSQVYNLSPQVFEEITASEEDKSNESDSDVTPSGGDDTEPVDNEVEDTPSEPDVEDGEVDDDTQPQEPESTPSVDEEPSETNPEPEDVVTPDPDIDNSIVITPEEENYEEKPEIIEEEPQDNNGETIVIEPENPDEDFWNYNPDEDFL